MPSFLPLKHSTGFTLMEVLIAMLVLALGAGGIISMQIHALRMARESAYQASAVALAVELAEFLHDVPVPLSLPASTGIISNCYRQVCDAGGMTAFFINDWQQRLQHALPQARARLCHDQGEQLRWDCSNNPQDSLFIKIGWASPQRNADTPGLMLASGR